MSFKQLYLFGAWRLIVIIYSLLVVFHNPLYKLIVLFIYFQFIELIPGENCIPAHSDKHHSAYISKDKCPCK